MRYSGWFDMQIIQLVTSHCMHNEFLKVWLQEHETVLNEIHGNVAYNISKGKTF